MCLILLAWRQHADFPLVVAANRDEFHARPAERAGFWKDHPGILAGRDLEANGSWMGVSRSGRYIGFMTFAGTHQYDRETGKVTQLSNEGGHGVIDWYQK